MVNAVVWLVLPAILSILTFWLLPALSNLWVNHKQSSIVALVGFIVSSLIVLGAFYASKSHQTRDVEILNGYITGKTREHDHYLSSYQCNCTQSCSGSGQNRSCTTTCQTCYEDHYTVTWTAQSTLGDYRIQHLDRLSKSVYSTPDPVFYTKVQKGEPCVKPHSYTNYIKAVPESLFKPAASNLKQQFGALIPPYPLNVYGLWRLDRVLSVGMDVPIDLNEWNLKLSEVLKTLGAKKQVNAIVVLVNTSDPNYAYALQDAWVNGKKNDVVVIIGTTSFPQKADWVHVLALTSNEMFKVKLRDDILALPELTADGVVSTLSADINELYSRKRMRDFKYLDDEIMPPDWVAISVAAFVTLAFLAGWFYAWRQGWALAATSHTKTRTQSPHRRSPQM